MAVFTIEIEDTPRGRVRVTPSVVRKKSDGPGLTLAEQIGWSLVENWVPEELEYFRRGYDDA